MKVWLGRVAVWLFVALVVAYGVDLAQVSARGQAGLGSVTVRHMVVAPLKGQRSEYYNAGTSDEPCSKSMFPQEGVPACWWLAGHAEQ